MRIPCLEWLALGREADELKLVLNLVLVED